MKQNTYIFYSLLCKKNKSLILAVLFFALINGVHAQNAFLSSGNTVETTNGSISYSVGQISQNLLSSSDGSLIQGIQFYHENSTLEIIDLQNNLKISMFPNPTVSILNIKMETNSQSNPNYSICDIHGREVKKGKLSGILSKIDLQHLDNATYLLKIHDNANGNSKSFKIIKN